MFDTSPELYCRDCEARTPTLRVETEATDPLDNALRERRCSVCGRALRKETV